MEVTEGNAYGLLGFAIFVVSVVWAVFLAKPVFDDRLVLASSFQQLCLDSRGQVSLSYMINPNVTYACDGLARIAGKENLSMAAYCGYKLHDMAFADILARRC